MKIFLSWSGGTSHKVAIALRDWLPSVIQSIQPYVSSEDIDKGARWSTDIAKELEDSSFGILCVTQENVNAPWLNFEAGALSKTIDKSYVSPFLFNIKRSEVNGPILQFQSTIFDKEDIKKLLLTINSSSSDECLAEERLITALEVWYPKLEEDLNSISSNVKVNSKKVKESKNAESKILEEVLELTRMNQKLLRNPEHNTENVLSQSDILEEMLELTKINQKLLQDSDKKHEYKINEILNTLEKRKKNSIDEQTKFFSKRLFSVLRDMPCEDKATELNKLELIINLYKNDYPWLFEVSSSLITSIQKNYIHSHTPLMKKLEYYIDSNMISLIFNEQIYSNYSKAQCYIYRELSTYLHHSFSTLISQNKN